MFFFFPIPAGVYLYLVVSNIIQTFQTWLISRMPEAPFSDDGETAPFVSPGSPSSADRVDSVGGTTVPAKQDHTAVQPKPATNKSEKNGNNGSGSQDITSGAITRREKKQSRRRKK
jgi:membrane protein insertase Oxa1/YidC/SpoIIIJ